MSEPIVKTIVALVGSPEMIAAIKARMTPTMYLKIVETNYYSTALGLASVTRELQQLWKDAETDYSEWRPIEIDRINKG